MAKNRAKVYHSGIVQKRTFVIRFIVIYTIYTVIRLQTRENASG
jgi:hypothetical protein